MPERDPATDGRRIPDEYDEHREGRWDAEGAAARLAELAGTGPVLALGVDARRLAPRLADRGLEVHGPDAADGGRTFALVVLASDTIFALPDQDAQVRCVANAAAHLGPGGRLAVAAWIPEMERFTTGPAVRVSALREDRVVLEIARIDPVAQRMVTTQVSLRDGDVRLYPATHRYAWPSELDLMARLAGMELDARHEDWRQTPFTAHSTTHVSVYRKR